MSDCQKLWTKNYSNIQSSYSKTIRNVHTIHTSVEVYSSLMDARAENEFYTAGLPDDYEGGELKI